MTTTGDPTQDAFRAMLNRRPAMDEQQRDSDGKFGSGGGSNKKADRDASGEEQKKKMAESVGMTHISGKIDTTTKKDHGADPLGNGKFRMVPSGDIVDAEERNKRLPPVKIRSGAWS